MKNYFKRIIMSLILAITCMCGIANVYAQTNMNITKKTYITTGIGSRKEAKFYTNKGYAYCITPDKTGPKQGTSLKYVKRENSGSVLYLLSKTGTSDTEYLITQLAMWKVNSNYTPDIYKQNANNSIVKKAMSLADEAAKNNNYSTEPAIAIKPSSEALSLTSDGKYYKSVKIDVKTNNTGAVVLSLSNQPNGTQIVDTKDNVKTTFNSGESFYVRVPVNSISKTVTFTLKATAKGKISYLETYSTSESKWQDLVVLTQEDKTVSESYKFSVVKQEGTKKPEATHNCVIYNGQYYDKDGNVTNKATYETNCITHKCEKFGDSYFDKDGKKVTQKEYEKQCVTHKCVIFDGEYYDKEGKVVDKATYEAKCITQPVTYTCKIVDGKYYGKDSKVTTKEDYETNCITHKCEIFGGYYFDKSGNKTTKLEYEKQCVSHKCVIFDGKYYDKDGNVVDKATYEAKCVTQPVVTYTCKIVDGKYYGKEGKETTKDDYETNCVTHKCEIFNGYYFDKDGKKTTKAEYEKQCGVHKCEAIDGTYYGPDGKEVTKDEYQTKCERHTCELFNGNYFDKSGNIVSQQEFENQCVHVCEIYDNHYYGSNGEITNEADYKSQCEAQIVPVPDTANVSPITLLFVVIGSGILGGTASVLYNIKSNNKA